MEQVVAGFERAQAAARDLSPASETRRTILIGEMKAWRREHARTPGSASKAGPALRAAQLATQRVEAELEETQEQVAQLEERVWGLEQKLEEVKEERDEAVRFARRFAYGGPAVSLLLHLSFSFIQLTIGQATAAEPVETSSLSEEGSSSGSIDEEEDVFAGLPSEMEHLDASMSAFNDIMTAVESGEVVLDKLGGEVEVEESAAGSVSNREARAPATPLGGASLPLVQKGDSDWTSSSGITESDDDGSSEPSPSLRASKRRRL